MIDDVAIGVRSAGARVFAEGIDAGLRWLAVAVAGALQLDKWNRGLAGTASAADVAAWTDANHRANRKCRQDVALGRRPAGLQDEARVLALVVETREAVRAVAVETALRLLHGTTVDLRITHVAGGTSAARDVSSNSALGAGRARSLVQTRIYTLSVDAGSIARTIAVAVTTDDLASLVRIAQETLAAATLRNVIDGHTLRVRATSEIGSQQTRIDAALINAALVAAALRVAAALYGLAGYLRIALVTLVAGTYRLVISHQTICVSSAVARIPATTIDARLVVAALVVTPAGSHDVQGY